MDKPTKGDPICCERATIYTTSEFMGNVVALEVRELTLWLSQWAQYSEVVYLKYKPKGARRPRQLITSGERPFLLVLRGWNHPPPPGIYGAPGRDGSVSGRYMSHDPRWRRDFDAMIRPHLDAHPGGVVWDLREGGGRA